MKNGQLLWLIFLWIEIWIEKNICFGRLASSQCAEARIAISCGRLASNLSDFRQAHQPLGSDLVFTGTLDWRSDSLLHRTWFTFQAVQPAWGGHIFLCERDVRPWWGHGRGGHFEELAITLLSVMTWRNSSSWNRKCFVVNLLGPSCDAWCF